MKRALLTMLVWSGSAFAQSVQTGSIGGMSYYVLAASNGCSAVEPCSVVTYLGYQSESGGATQQDLTNYFGGAFAQANPHTVVIAPIENGTQDATTNWGGYNSLNTPEQAQMIAVVQGVEAQMGHAVNPADSVVTGGSLGGTGTQAALVAAGPKGLTTPGVFSAGLSFDAALWTPSPAETAALCGVPLTAVHGIADTNQSISYDQGLQSTIDGNPACGNSFTLVPIQGAGHGTWSGPSGYQAGAGSGTPLGWLTSEIQSLSTGTITPLAAQGATSANQTPATPAPTPTTQQPITKVPSTDPTPGQGSATDCSGNTWTVSSNNKVLENGQPVLGGGDTSNLMIQGCSIFGKSNGHNGSSTSWFTLNGQNWAVASAPTGSATATLTAAAAAAPVVCGSGVPSGTFKVVGGQIIGPDGKPFIARGIDMSDSDMGSAAAAIAMFPGLNFVRLAVYSYQDPSAYAAFISTMTSRGTVVEIEHHVETDGSTAGGGQGGIASGAWLAQESAWYASMGRTNAANPYVWFGTTNEPPTAPGLSEWQQATYKAIRGAGDNSIILLEIAGWPGGWQTDMDPSVYASMTNVVWDTHFYGWVARYSTDQAAVNAALADEIAGAQTIPSADGKVPAMIAEYGPSTTGEGMDANGIQAVTAVINSGSAGTSAGSGAWHWGQQDCCNNLTLGSYQQMVALYINTSVIPCSATELASSAQGQITTLTNQLAAPASDQSAPASTTAALTDVTDPATAQADAAIAQANATVAAAQQVRANR